MKFICILGDSAVGKMTVGQILAKKLGFSLFHNHMTIEFVLDVFQSFHVPAIKAIRQTVFDEFIQTNLPGLIFTFQLAFNVEEDQKYLHDLITHFEKHDVETYIVELDASLDVRLKRNQTPNRLHHKPSKRDIAISEKRLLNDYEKYRCISKPGEIKHPRFLQIDNTHLEAETVANQIIEYFALSYDE